MTWPIQHLTAEDLDAFHSASLSPQSLQHLDECQDCRSLVERDRLVLQMLETLEPLSPREGFADRVLAQVARPAVVAVPVRRRPVALAASVMVALGASVVWSLFNRALLGSWIERGGAVFRNLVWDGIATLAQNLSEQPWIASLREFGGSSGRIAVAASVLVAGYVAAMIAFRRLLLVPAPAANPKW